MILIHISTSLKVFYMLSYLSLLIKDKILFLITKGRGIGGGDIKLMAVSGLLLGWKLNILAFALGCIIGSIIHIIRMKVTKTDHVLALGPYLSIGIIIATLWGNDLLQWYFAAILKM